MYTEPVTADTVAKWLTEESTGSLKYLTLTISVDKGAGYVQIPGSPFQDYYIGDSEGGIDITDYISFGSTNTIKVEASEYGGAGDVRFEISLSLMAQVVLTSI
jgi:hypothetical protein